jgi:hypothetical protein
MPSSATPTSAPAIERWRCPAVLRVKSAVTAAAGAAAALVFFPLWFAVPVTVACAAWGLGMATGGASVTVDGAAGQVVLRMGLITRRIRLLDVTAVLVEDAKVSIARASGGEISVYAWRKSTADRLLRAPVVAGDVGHAISRAVALAQAYASPAGQPETATPQVAPATGRTPARTRSRLATLLLGVVGVVAIVGALVIRVHWGNPALTVGSAILALALGVSGLGYLLVAFWILLTGRAPRLAGHQ